MICRACGRIIANENANFCEYCGTAVDENRDGGVNKTVQFENYSAGQENNYNNNDRYRQTDSTGQPQGAPGLIGVYNGTAGMAQAEGSMSFWHWILVVLLPYVPVIGSFAFMILLFVWGFGHTASTTRKNWARATLVMIAVALIMMSYMLSSLMGQEGISELMNSIMGTQPQ